MAVAVGQAVGALASLRTVAMTLVGSPVAVAVGTLVAGCGDVGVAAGCPQAASKATASATAAVMMFPFLTSSLPS